MACCHTGAAYRSIVDDRLPHEVVVDCMFVLIAVCNAIEVRKVAVEVHVCSIASPHQPVLNLPLWTHSDIYSHTQPQTQPATLFYAHIKLFIVCMCLCNMTLYVRPPVDYLSLK